MPIETLTNGRRVVSENGPSTAASREDDALRTLALRHLERVRKFRVYLAVYGLSLLALTPVWIVTQYEQADGWLEHLSTRSRYPGDWDPWILWVALIGAVVVGIAGIRAYVDRPRTKAEIDREVARLRSLD